MATTITALSLTDDGGTPDAPDGDGTLFDADLFADLEANINALLAGDLTLGGDLTLEDGDLDITGAVSVSSTVSATGGYKERGRSTTMGEWIAVPFSALNFFGAEQADSWQVQSLDVVVNRYTLIGKTLIWNLKLANTTVLSGENELRATIPGGFTAAASSSVRVAWSGASSTNDLLAETVSGQTYLKISRLDNTDITASSAQFMYLVISIELS